MRLYPLAWAALGLRLTRPEARGLLDRLARLHLHTQYLSDKDADKANATETTAHMGKTSIKGSDEGEGD